MLPILLAIDLIGVVVFRGRSDTANLRIILPGAMLGIALGWLTFGHVDARWIKLLIGIEAVLFAIDRFRAARSSGIAVASAPTLGPASSGARCRLHQLRLARRRPADHAVPDAAEHGQDAPGRHHGDLLHRGEFRQARPLCPARPGRPVLPRRLAAAGAGHPVGYYVGYRLLQAVDMRGFNLVTAWTLLAAGTKLVHDGMAG
jgi:uncharacterized membrane protein YfcA